MGNSWWTGRDSLGKADPPAGGHSQPARKKFGLWWTRGESNPLLLDAIEACYRYTTGPSPSTTLGIRVNPSFYQGLALSEQPAKFITWWTHRESNSDLDNANVLFYR